MVSTLGDLELVRMEELRDADLRRREDRWDFRPLPCLRGM
jgi:hypothetical protein